MNDFDFIRSLNAYLKAKDYNKLERQEIIKHLEKIKNNLNNKNI